MIQGLDSGDYENVRATIVSLYAPHPSTRGRITAFLDNFGDGNPRLSCVRTEASAFAYRVAQSSADVQSLQTLFTLVKKLFEKYGPGPESVRKILAEYYSQLPSTILKSGYGKALNTQAGASFSTMHVCLIR